MKTKVMLDLETLGNRPGSAIVAIGAVKFGNGEILDEFYTRIDAESCVKLGLEMDTSTVMWWLQQADGPRLEITKPGKHICEALGDFSTWVADPDAEMWGNGAAFDNVLLATAYHAAARKAPWEFWNNRCYRTMKTLHPEVPMERAGTHHNALDDAKSQARHLMAILSLSNARAVATTYSRSSDTPETDDHQKRYLSDDAQSEDWWMLDLRDHARKMERDRNEAIRILRVLKSDIDHIGHWVPDPCRKMVEQFLSENAQGMEAGADDPPMPGN